MEQMYCERFWKYRERFHLTQEELAERIGVSRQTVSKWERGESSPDTENLLKLSRLYGVSIDALLHSDPTPSAEGAQKREETDWEAESGGVSGSENVTSGSGTSGNGASLDGTNGSATNGSAMNGSAMSGNGIGENAIGANALENGTAAEHTEGQTATEGPLSAEEETYGDDAEDGTEAQAEEGESASESTSADTSTSDETDGHTDAESLTGIVAGIAAVVTAAAYLFLGCCLQLWHPGWLIFFLIPICALISEAIIYSKKCGRVRLEALTGMVAVGVTAGYLFLGCCLHLWHPGWLIFFLIPIWAILADVIDGRGKGHFLLDDLTGAVAVSVTAVYLFLGCCLHLWHPGWLIFLLIPVWAVIAEAIDRSR